MHREKHRILSLNEHLLDAHSQHSSAKHSVRWIGSTTPIAKQRFCSNSIRTTKYKWWNFVFKNLWEQFHRVSNIFFLIIAVLQFIPGLSPIGNITVIFPLASIIVISALKALFEDVRRWISDRRVNATPCHRINVVRPGGAHSTLVSQREKVQWRSLRVGDIIEIRHGDEVPADVLLLTSSDRHSSRVFLEMSKLDGETNYKARHVLESVLYHGPNDDDNDNNSELDVCCDLVARIACEEPSSGLFDWHGSIEYIRISDLTKQEDNGHLIETLRSSIDLQNVAFRGSRLVGGTEWVRGIVIYTGADSKIMLNRTRPSHKKSTIERFINWYILVWICIIIGLAIVSVVAEVVWMSFNVQGAWYLQEHDWSTSQRIIQTVRDFLSFIILYNTLLPIVMYVSYELAQLGQSGLVQQDLKLYDPESDIPATVKTSAIIEELGQIEYIFMDKTGTLTENDMTLVYFSVCGVSYSLRRLNENDGNQSTQSAKGKEPSSCVRVKENKISTNLEEKGIMAITKSNDTETTYGSSKSPVESPALPAIEEIELEATDGKWLTFSSERKQHIVDLFLCLCLCNTVIPNAYGERIAATSRDEEAFLSAASKLGIKLVHRSARQLTISVFGEEQIYELLHLIEFDPNRKCMEVIVRTPLGNIMLICKGADMAVEPMLAESMKESTATVTRQLLGRYSSMGLRTLVCAKAEIPEYEYMEWASRFEEANLALNDRKSRMYALIHELVQRSPLQLVGITAVEDVLQEGVPNTIDALQQADINCWMLTGDKLETAVSVSRLSRLIGSDIEPAVLCGESSFDISKQIEDQLRSLTQHPHERIAALVISGVQTQIILSGDAILRKLFLSLIARCKSVIACRLTPKEKAHLVSLVRTQMGKTTLAIGDGSNDVSMIQAANVGIGIAGSEGMQAANSADISIAKFRFLQRLLFVHGRSNYRRNSIILLFNCYKSVVLYMTQFYYAWFNGFTQASIHERWTLSVFQQLLTLLPPIIFAIFDSDIPDHVAEHAPELYKQGQNHKFFNARRFAAWLMNSVWHSAICFFVPFLSLSQLQLFDGRALDEYSIGITIYSSVLLVIHGRLILETSSINLPFVLSLLFSAVAWICTVFVLGALWQFFPYHRHPWREFYASAEMYIVFWQPSFYLSVLLTTGVALMRDFVWKAVKRSVATTMAFYSSGMSTGTLYYRLLGSRNKAKALNKYREGPLRAVQSI